jgi:hypothetical protein
MRKPSESGLGKEPSWQTLTPVINNGMEGKLRRESGFATGEGKPLKAKAQGRYRHETRPGRLRAEQGVKRLRKPGGAAQPGEANPVLVTARFCKRRRVQNPMRGGQGLFSSLWVPRGRFDRASDSPCAKSRALLGARQAISAGVLSPPVSRSSRPRPRTEVDRFGSWWCASDRLRSCFVRAAIDGNAGCSLP